MALPQSLTKEVFIRLDGDGAFVSTVKYGCFHSKTKRVPLASEAPDLTPQESVMRLARHLVPPVTLPSKKRSGT